MLLTAKYVVPVTAPFIEDGAVLVRNDKIVAVGTAQELKEKYPVEKVKDFGLAALLPGFVDCHTHLRYTALRGLFEDMPYADWKRSVLRCEPFFEDADWDDSARLGALEAIASGITTLADISIPDSAVKALNESGLRGVVYREVMTMRPDHVDAVMDEALKDLEAWGETINSDRITLGLAAGPVYATHPKVFAAIAKYVGNGDMPVAMHLGGSHEEAEFIRYGSSKFSIHATQATTSLDVDTAAPWLPTGVSPVRYVYNWDILGVPNMMIIHAVQVDETDLKIIKQENVSVVHCPRINAKLSMGAAPVQEMLNMGITVGLGTDSPAAVDTTDMIDEMRVALIVNRSQNIRGISGEKMLAMATIDAAKALRMDKEIGSLEVGKKADIIAIDLHNSHQNPTSNPAASVIHTANQDNVMWTMVDGRVLYDNFVHVSGMPRDEIVERSRKLREKIRVDMNNEEKRSQIISGLADDLSDRLKR